MIRASLEKFAREMTERSVPLQRLGKRDGLAAVAAAAMPVATETLTVTLYNQGEQYAFPTLAFVDRRGRKPWRVKTWCLVRGIERILYGMQAGARSTGRFALHLSSQTLSDAVLVADKQAVTDGVLMQEELQAGVASDVALPLPAAPRTDADALRPSPQRSPQ